jgi:hypothetical protein
MRAQVVQAEDLVKNPSILHSDGSKVQFALAVICALDESGQRNNPTFDRMYTTLFKISESYAKWIGSYLRPQQV